MMSWITPLPLGRAFRSAHIHPRGLCYATLCHAMLSDATLFCKSSAMLSSCAALHSAVMSCATGICFALPVGRKHEKKA